MNHGSLFTGICGFDLAAEWMGWNNIFHCEWNEFGRRISQYYWPKAISYGDITKTDFSVHRGQIDILTGGFPCQPYSTAGKRLGKEDDRHLWPEMLRAIREIQPSWVVGENVRGLLNWNGGLVFDEVQADLEAEGYEVTPFILPACAVNAPHRRDRIWFIAYSINNRYSEQSGPAKKEERIQGISRQAGHSRMFNGTAGHDGIVADTCSDGRKRNKEPEKINNRGIQKGLDKGHESDSKNGDGNAANPNNERFSGKRESTELEGRRFGVYNTQGNKTAWQNFPTQSPVCGRNDGISDRLDGITFSKWRTESIKGYGNAIVPQVAYEIFKAIKQTS